MITRRSLIAAALAGAGGSGIASLKRTRPGRTARVAIIKADSYDADFEQLIARGLRECGIDLRGKAALVKPNLVEHVPEAPVHTHPNLLAGCIAALQAEGARVVAGEGPGHRRDTIDMAVAAGYRHAIPRFDSTFTDLNLDDVGCLQNFCGEPRFYLPATALAADVIVSVAKMKTHHWAGATLSMKNLFGVVPGAVYGWPKNKLHFIGIDKSIGALYRRFPRSIGIVDGVIGMEGNGPIQGSPARSRVIVLGSDLAAVDATCCRIMGIDPARIGYLQADDYPTSVTHIEQRGESVSQVACRYELPPRLAHLRA